MFLLRQFKIGVRLLLSFIIIIFLMFIGGLVGFSQLRDVQIQAEHLYQIDLQIFSILQQRNHHLTLINEFEQAVGEQNELEIEQSTHRLQESFLRNINQVKTSLATFPASETETQATLTQLQALNTTIMLQFEALSSLAEVEDWFALNLQLEEALPDVLHRENQLIEGITDHLVNQRMLTRQNIQQTQQQARFTFSLTAIFLLIGVILLGYSVTRSIALPLAELDEAACALAKGQFQHAIEPHGRDELTYLAEAFNQTASQLATLYTNLENLAEQRTTELKHRALQLETNVAMGQRITLILDPRNLLNQAVALIQAQYDFFYVAISLLDPTDSSLVIKANINRSKPSVSEQEHRMLVDDDTIFAGVIQLRKPAWINDVLTENRYRHMELLPGIRSQLILPLVMGQKLLGVLEIQSEKPNAFLQDDIPVFQSLADQLAIAIENAERYQREKSGRYLIETLYQIGRALTSTLNLSEVLSLILESLSKIVTYNWAAVMLKQGDELEVLTTLTPHKMAIGGEFLPLRVTIKKGDVYDQVCHAQEPVIITEIADKPSQPDHETLPVQIWMGIPLIRGDEVIGIVALIRETAQQYEKDEVALVSTFAGQAAIALENARLYDEITRFSQRLEEKVEERTQALQQAYNQLKQLDKTKSDFITLASHELRTPLTILQGYSELLIDDPLIQSNEAYTEMVSGIEFGAMQLQSVVESLLDIAKIDTQALKLSISQVVIKEVISPAIASFAEAIQTRNLTVTIADMTHLPAIEVDKVALGKVFYHLISNAIKYTPDKGEIVIKAKILEKGTDFALTEETNTPLAPFPTKTQAMTQLISNASPVDYVEVVVCDTGIGIHADVQRLIFEKFFQTGELSLHATSKTQFKGGGAGLGLTIARGIILAHRGQIWVKSPCSTDTTHPGSEFHIILPVQQPK